MTFTGKIVAISAVSLVFTGCSQPADGQGSVKNGGTSTAQASAPASQEKSSQPAKPDESQTKVSTENSSKEELASDNSREKPATTATAKADPAKSQTVDTSKTTKAQTAKQAAPTTATQAIATIDLLALPRLNEKRLMESCPTYVYYSAEGTLTSADAFFKAELSSKGWKELPALTPGTDSYVDRHFEKDSYVIRISLSVGSTQGELAVMMMNLGNVDVRNLPQMPDADKVGIPTTAVNATHKTSRTIPEVADALNKEILALGWQPYADFHDTPMDVPHYRSFRYRKEAVRIILGIVKNPQDPAEKTTVYYHAEYVIPFDIPTTKSDQNLKLDMFGNRAAFDFSSSRDEMVALLRKESERFGWKLSKPDEFAAGETHAIPIETKSGQYLLARLVESAGKYSVSIEKSIKPVEKKPETPTQESIAKNDTSVSKQPAKSEIQSEIEKLHEEANAEIQAELSKALGSLKGLSAGGQMNLADMQAQADRINKSLGQNDDDQDDKSTADSNKNPFDVPEETVQLTDADKAINASLCTIKYGDKTYQLKNTAAYVLKEYDDVTKCIIFSEGNLNTDKLGRMLLKEGRPVYASDVSDVFKGSITIHITNNNVMINAMVDHGSLSTNASQIKADVKYVGGKLVGHIGTSEAIEMGSQMLEFTADINQAVIKPDWNKRKSPEAQKLVPDESKDFLVPEGYQGYSSEGSKYKRHTETAIEAPLKAVEQFYLENLSKLGWKLVSKPAVTPMKYQMKDQDLELTLTADGSTTKIEMNTRNQAAAKADGMLPPEGKSLLVLGNMSDANIQVTIAGKAYTVKPSTPGSDPKDAPHVIVAPGKTKIEIKEGNGKTATMEANTDAGTTWGVLYDTSFQDVMRLF
ncbi:MAG: hypothetical protein U0930_08125 [Pirellulales bacterium]